MVFKELGYGFGGWGNFWGFFEVFFEVFLPKEEGF